MIARQIQSRLWNDEFIENATWQSKYVFIYLCTCSPMNKSGVFQLSDKKIMFETGLSEENFLIAKEELSQAKKVLFCEGWVYVVNAFKNLKVWKSPSNWESWEEEWSKVNTKTRTYFDTGVGTGVYTAQKQEIEKQKQEVNNHEQMKQVKSKQEDSKMMTKEETDKMDKWAEEAIN